MGLVNSSRRILMCVRRVQGCLMLMFHREGVCTYQKNKSVHTHLFPPSRLDTNIPCVYIISLLVDRYFLSAATESANPRLLWSIIN